MNEVTISIPITPKPYQDANRDCDVLLSVEVHDAKDGYGILSKDMVPGRSITIRADQDYQARLTYMRDDGKSPYPIFLYVHPRNKGKTYLAWQRVDGSEAGGNMSPGTMADLRDWGGQGRWIIEGAG